jgi:predicted house-cleaning noncanonical NTP pyrophosphatase (MazG superfamily)
MDYAHINTDLDVENKYPKLVRDKLTKRVADDGKHAEYFTAASGRESLKFIKTKLVEEATEFKHAKSTNHALEELADVLEVIDSALAALGSSHKELTQIKLSKKHGRGGLNNRIIMKSAAITKNN